MKVWAPLLALVAFAAAQSQENAISIPNGGLQVTAGQSFTLTWTNPSSGTVTIKLQQGAGVTGDTGITIVSVPASALSATFTIPADEVNTSQYNFEMVDDTNPSNVNFSNGFSIAGASCVGTCDGGSSSTAAASASASSASASAAASSTASESSASASSTSSESAAASSASSSASQSSAAASSSATAAVTTSAPSSNQGAGNSFQAQAGLVVAIMAAIAAF